MPESLERCNEGIELYMEELLLRTKLGTGPPNKPLFEVICRTSQTFDQDPNTVQLEEYSALYKLLRVSQHVKLFHSLIFSLLLSAMKLRQGNVFTPVCHSVHRGGVCLSACWYTHLPLADTPQADTPPGRHTPPG